MAESCLLYYITDRSAFPGDESARQRLLLDKVAEAARAGVEFIQLREKDLSTRELEFLACESVALLTQLRTENRELKTVLLINSRVDVAMAAGAGGVHLRSDDISPLAVRDAWRQFADRSVRATLAPAAPVIAVSCHSLAEVEQAAASGATLAVFAPVFEKKDAPGAQPAGLARLREACNKKIPVLALGGVTLENAQSCLDAGAAGIAAIRLFQENDVAQVVKSFRG